MVFTRYFRSQRWTPLNGNDWFVCCGYTNCWTLNNSVVERFTIVSRCPITNCPKQWETAISRQQTRFDQPSAICSIHFDSVIISWNRRSRQLAVCSEPFVRPSPLLVVIIVHRVALLRLLLNARCSVSTTHSAAQFPKWGAAGLLRLNSTVIRESIPIPLRHTATTAATAPRDGRSAVNATSQRLVVRSFACSVDTGDEARSRECLHETLRPPHCVVVTRGETAYFAHYRARK